MWIFTPIGGYSVVNRHRNTDSHTPSGELAVRSRSHRDLNNLKKAARVWKIPSIADAEITSTASSDYSCRMLVPIEDWQNALVRLSNIAYSDFKEESVRVNGQSHYSTMVLPNIWSTWRECSQDDLEELNQLAGWPPRDALHAIGDDPND